MPELPLTSVSYLVLGLVGRAGEATPYDLKRWAAQSIGHFWAFPHSQLYAEPVRLAAAGLLEERRESTGRRRRTYSLTDAGLAALRRWLREPTVEPPQIRDLALLKLFFGQFVSVEEVAGHARVQEAAHRARLAAFHAIDNHLADHEPERVAHARAALRMGVLCEEAFVRFWGEIAERPPDAAGKRRRKRSSTEQGPPAPARG
jgi:PadR family transcriptional regulator, regulatory protein AphA